jgi:hypothetical protein
MWKRKVMRLWKASVALLAMLVFIVGMYTNGKALLPQLAGLAWTKTQGELLEVQPVADHRWNVQLDVKYRYEVDGTEYVGTRDRGLLTRHDHEFNTAANERVQELRQSKQVDVYFDAADPSQSMLTPGVTADGWMVFLKTLVFSGIGLVAWLGVLATRHNESNQLQIVTIPPWMLSFLFVGIICFVCATFFFLYPGVSSKMFLLLHMLILASGYAVTKRLSQAQVNEDEARARMDAVGNG